MEAGEVGESERQVQARRLCLALNYFDFSVFPRLGGAALAKRT